MSVVLFFFLWAVGVLLCLGLLRVAVWLLMRLERWLWQMEGVALRAVVSRLRPFSFFLR